MPMSFANLPLSVHLDSTSVPLRVYYLTDYNPSARQLILDAKVGCCCVALDSLVEAFVIAAKSRGIDNRHDRIVAAPSSLWSRLRGRFDVGYELAFALAQESGVRLHRAPLGQYWRLRKRAFLNKSQVEDTEVYFPTNTHKVVLVDDIATTGWTLLQMAIPYLRRGYMVEALVFALAGQYLHRARQPSTECTLKL